MLLIHRSPCAANAVRTVSGAGELFVAAVVVCMGDGSVRVVNTNVSQQTWYSAISPADGIPLGSDW